MMVGPERQELLVVAVHVRQEMNATKDLIESVVDLAFSEAWP
jgi:hypothetical protein